ncbi:MAG: cupin domain-containing protein [Gammaproteobacteria bacterium]|nr:cupin domain-containing protein [Gammaproteobacteria bacterium]
MIIHCEHRASPAKLDVLCVDDWPVWEKEISEFSWHYDKTEICYFVRGEAIVTPDGGEPQTFKRGDLITFPAGLSCTWKITKDVEKHYSFQ